MNIIHTACYPTIQSKGGPFELTLMGGPPHIRSDASFM
jgi:hypothetical protein